MADDAGFPTVDPPHGATPPQPEPDPIGAAFERIRQGAQVGPGITFLDDGDPPPAVRAPDHSGNPQLAAGDLPPFRPLIREDTSAPVRTVQVRATGDDEVDAMLMLRAVMDQQPVNRHRRLLEYLADRYA